MKSRIAQAWLGAVWTVAGTLMAFNPAPPGRVGHRVPIVGVITVAGGIYFALKALRTRDVDKPGSGQTPRHADRGSTLREGLTLTFVGTAMIAAGAATMWWGISSGLLSVVGLAIGALGLAIPATAFGARELWSLRRANRA
jgi:hypothetical protein